MTRPAYIRRKPENPEVQPYIVDRIESYPHEECVLVVFEGDGNSLIEYRTKVGGLHVAKGFFYFRGNYYTPDEWDELYMRVDDECPAQAAGLTTPRMEWEELDCDVK